MAALSSSSLKSWRERIASLEIDSASQRGPSVLSAISDAFASRSPSEIAAVFHARMKWCNDTPYLRVVTCDIPSGILPSGMYGKLHEVKVNPRGYGNKKGPPTDDACYEAEEKVRRLIPRGLCFIEVSKESNGQPIFQGPACFAMRKFSGGLGDEDNDDGKGSQNRWKCFFTSPAEQASIVCAAKKANGEAAHFSCVRIPLEDGGSILLKIAGSKHVHFCYRNATTDLDKYTEDRFALAKIVARTFEASPASQDIGLLEFLADTGLTSCFELEQPSSMHVEYFDFDAPRLSFLAFTPSDIGSVSGEQSEEDLSGHCLPPVFGYKVAAMFGLTPVPYAIHDVASVNIANIIHHVRRRWGDEGDVFYFVDESGHTIGLVKIKTVWYVVLRAIREKLRTMVRVLSKARMSKSGADDVNGKDETETNVTKLSKKQRNKLKKKRKSAAVKQDPRAVLTSSLRKVSNRLQEIQTWLNFDLENLTSWKKLADSFLRWSLDKFMAGGLCTEDISRSFPRLWREHLVASGLEDCFPIKLIEALDDSDSSGDEIIVSKQLTDADFCERVELHGGRIFHLTLRLGAKCFAPLFADEWTGSHIWPCSCDLSNILISNGYIKTGDERVIELGSGAGLVSIVAASLGAASVVATDQESLVDLVDTNARHNLKEEIYASKFEARMLDWAEVTSAHKQDRAIFDVSWDLILASDCINPVYGETNILDLANTVACLCVKASARFLLAYEERSGEEEEMGSSSNSAALDKLTLFDLFCEALNSSSPDRTYSYVTVWSEGKRSCHCFQVVQ